MGSEKLFRKDCTRVQFPIWLRGSVHISVHVLRRVAAGISSSLCIKHHSFGQFHSLTYINRWCWLLHKISSHYEWHNGKIFSTFAGIDENILNKSHDSEVKIINCRCLMTRLPAIMIRISHGCDCCADTCRLIAHVK